MYTLIDKNPRYLQHLTMLGDVTPAHTTFEQLQSQLEDLTRILPGSIRPSYRFDNIALLDTDCYRSEILRNVDLTLEKYLGDLTTENAESPKIEKDLLWVSLQLYAHLQAIEQEVGLILEPRTEFLQSLAKLEVCFELLKKNGSDVSKLEQLLAHKPLLDQILEGKWFEQAFKAFIQYIDDRNNTRLFWVWGRPNLDLALNYMEQEEARGRLADSTYIPGQISWSLYLFRGSLFALKMLDVWWNNPKWLKEMEALTPDERAMYRMRYLTTYWDVYKYRILNDYVWGPINFFCLDLWVGWFGDFATCFLLCMDIYLANLTFSEEEGKYKTNQAQHQRHFNESAMLIADRIQNSIKQELLKLNPDFDSLEKVNKISLLQDYLLQKQQDADELTDEEALLVQDLLDLEETRQAMLGHTANWQKKLKFLYVDCIYTKALLFAFAMCVAFLVGGFLPLALSAFFAKSGTILCLALTILYRTIRVQMQVAQAQEERAELDKQEDALFTEFNNLKVLQVEELNNKTSDGTQYDKKMQDIYLHLVNLGARIDYQSDSIQYQYLELARTTLMRFSIPALIGLTLVYAPATVLMLPAYAYTLALGAALAYVLDRWAKTYKPGEVKTTSLLDKDKYQTFFHAPKVFSKFTEQSVFCMPSFFPSR